MLLRDTQKLKLNIFIHTSCKFVTKNIDALSEYKTPSPSVCIVYHPPARLRLAGVNKGLVPQLALLPGG